MRPMRGRRPLIVALSLVLLGAAVAGSAWWIDTRSRIPLPDTSTLPAVDLTPAPERRAEVGFSLGAAPLGWATPELARHLDTVAATGVGWIRVDLDWSDVEARQGRHDWSTVDRVVAMAGERDLRVLGLLAYTPTWARPPGTGDKHPPLDDEWAARFGTAAVERYGSGGSGPLAGTIVHWEVWNEPNLSGFWEGGADPERYADLYNAMAGAIRAADPSATVIVGGLAPADDGDDDLSAPTFVERFLAAGAAGELIDAIAVHPYTYPALPGEDQSWNTWHRITRMSEITTDALGREVPVWATEFGAPTGGRRSVGLDRQAEIVGAALGCTAHQLAGPLFLYSVEDLDSTAPDRESHFGLVTSDGRAKPAWNVLTSYTSGALTPIHRCG